MTKKRWHTAPDDIYSNQKRYDYIRENLKEYTQPQDPNKVKLKGRARKYHIKNPANLKYFRKLLDRKDSEGTSYIRRIELFNVLLRWTHYASKDLRDLTRADNDKIVTHIRSELNERNARKAIIDMKTIAKIVIPEKDHKGRLDESIVPYSLRHIKTKIDPSRQKKKRKISPDEIQKVIQYFSQEPRLKALVSLMYESYGRPQEVLYTKVGDVEMHDNFAKIHISGHGKEGVKFLECIDSLPHLIEWLQVHPLRDDPTAFLFLNLGKRNHHGQMTIFNVNKHLRTACEAVGIKPHLTGYDLKRAGISHARLRGRNDVEIQHSAGWKSTRQLKAYDFSDHDDTFKQQLIRRGIVQGDSAKDAPLRPEHLTCAFCKKHNAIGDEFCRQCKRPLDLRDAVDKEKNILARLAKLEKLL